MEDLIEPVRHVELHEAVYRRLKRLLLSQRIDHGTRLDVARLEKQLGVSRTPLRYALNRLATERFIEVRARRGYFVQRPTMKDAMELYDLRLLLERYAAHQAIGRAGAREASALRAILDRQRGLAVRDPSDAEYEEFSRLDRDFHQTLVASAGNHKLAAIYADLDGHLQMARIYYRDAHNTMSETFAEHEAILRAFEAKDAATLEARLVAHIERFRDLVRANLPDAAPFGVAVGEE